MTRTAARTALPSVPTRSISETARAYDDGASSPVTQMEVLLERIAQHEPAVSAFSALDVSSARAQAEHAAAGLGSKQGALHGIPIGVKDMIDVSGFATTASSRVRADARPTADAPIVAALRRAGAVVLGKTHTHEFAYGLTTPTTRNPHDLDRVPGGSSGGSAAAVAAGFVLGAIGTDTGGSIRVPASLTGTVGLKPTFGLVPRVGVVPLSWSLDHVGPITQTVEDAGLLLNVLAFYDDNDPASRQQPPRDYTSAIGQDLHGVRVGVPTTFFFDRVADDVEAAARAAIARLADRGARLVPVDIPAAEIFHAAQWGLMVSEASAYHAPTLRTSADRYGDDVRILLEAGDHMLASDYIHALRARTLIIRAWNEMFEKIDVLAAPTTPHTAALAGQQTFEWDDGSSEAVSDAYVRLAAPANLTGRPAISVPAGEDRSGLPIGFQLIGQPFDEIELLRIAAAAPCA